MSTNVSSKAEDKKAGKPRAEDPSHPGMSPDFAERGRELGEENAYGGHSEGTGGHGGTSGGSSRQRVGGVHVTDSLKYTEEQMHPGMNPNEAERGAELGHENMEGGHSVGDGGHKTKVAKSGK